MRCEAERINGSDEDPNEDDSKYLKAIVVYERTHTHENHIFTSIIINKRVRQMHICNVTPNSTPFEESESIVSVDCNSNEREKQSA